MTSYTITVTEAELDVVRLALGRMISPKKVAAKKPAGPKRYVHRVPKLSDTAKARLARGWEVAVERPDPWRERLANGVAREMNYPNAEAVAKAWGIVA